MNRLRAGAILFLGLALGAAVGAWLMLWSMTGTDEVSEQIQAFRYLKAQARHWEQATRNGPLYANWKASMDLAIQDTRPQLSEADLRRDFQEWELLERCATNGVAKPPEGRGESRPQSLTPEAAAGFIRAMRGDKACAPCGGR